MIDLSVVDSGPGERPRRAPRAPAPGCLPRPERVLHLHLWTPVEPQSSLCAALAGLGEYRRLEWTRTPREDLGGHLLTAAREFQPTLLWMQLQTPGVVSPELLAQVRALAPGVRIVSWCGDVGRNPAWSHEIAPFCDAMFFSSTTQVAQHRAVGFPNAAYLQIGYDTETHYPSPPMAERHGVVFLGQRFEPSGWTFLPEQEIQLRTDAVYSLRAALGDDFACYGQNWPQPWCHPPLFPALSAERYRRAIAAVSVSITSKLGRYSSDRLFRALACGPVVLVKRFEDMAALGLEDGANCLVWDTPEQLAELARAVLTMPGSLRLRIGAAGAALALEHTWPIRMLEMGAYLEAIDAHRA